MCHLNKNNNNSYLIAAATIFTLAIVTASSMATAPVAATTTTTESAPPTTTSAPSSGLDLSPQPVLRERQITISQTPINQTHVLFTDSGNGTITLPNTTEAINFTGTDSVIVSIVDGTAIGKEVFTTLDGSETVNGTVLAMARFNMEEGTGRGIVILLLQTNSTGRLAPADGMILAGHIEFYPDGSAESTMWEWQSGVPLPTPITTVPPLQEPPLTDDTTPTTNATITADTNDTTTATTAATTTDDDNDDGDGNEATTNSVSIVSGSSELTDDAYQPNPMEVSIDDTVTWTNDDIALHTVTSGESGEPNGEFDSGIMSTGATFEHTFTEEGEYPYFCTLHPNMVGTVNVE